MTNKSVMRAAGCAMALLLLIGCQTQPAAPAPATAASKTAASPATAPTAATQPQSVPTTVPQAQPTQAPVAPTAAPKTMKVGVMVSLTGPSSRLGTNIERFTRLAIDDINAKGGLKVGGDTYRLEAVTVDDKSTAEGGREAANRLVLAEKVPVIIGPLGSPTAGAQAATEPAKVLLMSYSTSDKSLGNSFPLTFISSPALLMRAAAVYDWVKKDAPQVKKVRIVTSDDAAGRANVPSWERIAQERGFTMLPAEYFPLDIKDFSPLVTRMLLQDPDGLAVEGGGRAPLLLALLKTLNEQGFKGRTFGVSGELSAMKQGAPFMDGYTVMLLADWRADVVPAAEKAIHQRVVEKHGEAELEPAAVNAYNSMTILAQAIEKAGTVQDFEKVAKTLRDNEWTTIWSEKWGRSRYVGTKTFGLAAAPEVPIYVSGVRKGQVVTIDAIKGTMP